MEIQPSVLIGQVLGYGVWFVVVGLILRLILRSSTGRGSRSRMNRIPRDFPGFDSPVTHSPKHPEPSQISRPVVSWENTGEPHPKNADDSENSLRGDIAPPPSAAMSRLLWYGVAVLVVAVLPWPTEFYYFVRWSVFLVCLLALITRRTFSWENNIPIALIALIYNPLITPALTRGLWTVIDLVCAGYLGGVVVGLWGGPYERIPTVLDSSDGLQSEPRGSQTISSAGDFPLRHSMTHPLSSYETVSKLETNSQGERQVVYRLLFNAETEPSDKTIRRFVAQWFSEIPERGFDDVSLLGYFPGMDTDSKAYFFAEFRRGSFKKIRFPRGRGESNSDNRPTWPSQDDSSECVFPF
jgi:hypothetical protein